MSWFEIQIGELGRIVTGKTPPTKNRSFFQGLYQFVTPSDLSFRNYYCRSTEVSVTEEARNKFKNQFVPQDAIMFTCIGNTIGKCGISYEPCLTNQQINSIIPSHQYDPKFVYYLMLHNVEKVRAIGIGGGSATSIVNKTLFSKILVKVPSRQEQSQIGKLLSAYDDLIETNRRRIQLLEQSARLLYKEWFVRLRFPGHERVKIKNGVPEGWRLGPIEDLGKIVTGKTPIKKNESFYGKDIPFIKTPDMHGNTIVVHTEENLSEKGANSQPGKTLPSRSILVSCIGTVGIVSLNGTPAQTNQQINAIVPKEESLRYWTYFMARELKTLLEGMGGGATMPNVNKSKFSAIKTTIPSKIVLDKFNYYISDQIDQIERLSLINLKLAKARDLLLPRLMNGEIIKV